jgi:hypothetical protein
VFVLQGGTQRNLAAVKAQVDYILERVPDAEIVVHPHCGEAGALGAAMETLRVVKRRGRTSFIGLDSVLALQYLTRNDETTVCQFCANRCSRTFIDTSTPDGRLSRYISGFSCERGTVESHESLRKLNRERTEQRKRYPNLVAEEAELAFRHFHTPVPLPRAGTAMPDRPSRWFAAALGVSLRPRRHRFTRSNAELGEIKIGLPRVLNMYALGPFFRTYFETLGIAHQNIIWSPPTSEEMWAEGGRYGSIDPCFPSKVVQAHQDHLKTVTLR